MNNMKKLDHSPSLFKEKCLCEINLFLINIIIYSQVPKVWNPLAHAKCTQ